MSGADFVGNGFRFPIRVNARGGLSWSEGPARIADAIWLVIATARGERVMRPRFGAGVQEILFQPNTAATRAALAGAIKSALTAWEPRIDVIDVRADAPHGDPSQVIVTIEYQIRTTNQVFNVVYPFFLQEGVR